MATLWTIIKNKEKTNAGELIDCYECRPQTAQAEFLLSKKLYAQKTGRDQGKNDVIAYHVRMSFKPGEVTAEKALAMGRDLLTAPLFVVACLKHV